MYTFKNGLRLHYYPVSTAYSVCIGLYVKAGSVYEDQGNNGISHLLEHMHFRRLGSLTQKELYHFTDLMGTTLMASTYKDFTKYYMKIRPQHLRKSVGLFKDIIEMYDWTEEDLELEKKVVINQICEKRGYENTDSILWKNSSFALPIAGNQENVQNIQLSDLIEFKRRHYHSGDMAIVITGKIEEEDIVFLNDYLSNVNVESKEKSSNAKLPLTLCERKPDVVFVNYDCSYLDVSICFDVTLLISSEMLTLLNCIVGGGTSSWLEKRLREEIGMTADIYSDVEFYSGFSLLKINYSVDKKDFYRSLHEILSILKNAKNIITKEDMSENILFYTDNQWFLSEDMESLNAVLGWDTCVFNKPMYTIENLIDIYSNITESDLQTASQTIFRPKNASVVVSGSISGLTKKEIRSILSNLEND